MIIVFAAATLAVLFLLPLARAWEIAPDLGHGWAAALLAGYLWWERWPPAFAAGRSPGLFAWLGCGLALALLVPVRLYLTPYPLWPMMVVLYAAVLVGMALALAWLAGGGAMVRWLAGPLVIFLAAIPWPAMVETSIIMPLREGIAVTVSEICNLLGRPALASGTSVQLAGGWVGIDEACGGIRSLQASVMVALFFGEWLVMGWRRRIGLVGLAALAAVGGNFGRILFLSVWADGASGSLDKWHDPAGWGALGFSLLATGALGWWLRPAASLPPVSAPAGGTALRPGPALSRLLVLVAVGLLALEAGVRWWYLPGAARAREAVPQWTVRLPADHPTYRVFALTDLVRDMLRPDHYAAAHWRGGDGRERTAYYVEWQKGQVARHTPFQHNPTVCLPYSGCELLESLGTVPVKWARGTIPFHAYIFRQMNMDLVVAFVIWDPVRGKSLQEPGPGDRQSLVRTRWRDVIEARPDQPAQLLALAIQGRENLSRLTGELEALIQAANEETN